eukprot:3993184-Pyramimonas_sp.AAC.1
MRKRLAQKEFEVKTQVNLACWTQHATAAGFQSANNMGNGFPERFFVYYGNKPPTDWASVKLNLRAASKREEVTPDEIVLVIRLACKHQGSMREDGR